MVAEGPLDGIEMWQECRWSSDPFCCYLAQIGFPLHFFFEGIAGAPDRRLGMQDCRTRLRIGHPHHLIGDAVGFAFGFALRVADGELWLDGPRWRTRARLQQTVDGTISDTSLETGNRRFLTARVDLRPTMEGRTLRVRALPVCGLPSRDGYTH